MLRVGPHFFCHVGVADAAFCRGSARGAGSHETIRGRGGGAVYCVADSLFVLMRKYRADDICGITRHLACKAVLATRDIYIEIFDFVMCILACLPKK